MKTFDGEYIVQDGWVLDFDSNGNPTLLMREYEYDIERMSVQQFDNKYPIVEDDRSHNIVSIDLEINEDEIPF